MRRQIKITIHPKYDFISSYYDVAVLELNQPVTFTKFVKPICLPERPDENLEKYKDDFVTLTGWSKNSRLDKEEETTLGDVHLKVFSQRYNYSKMDVSGPEAICPFNFFSHCNFSHQNYLEESQWKLALPHLFSDNTFCAGYENGNLGSCIRDSGGPLLKFVTDGPRSHYRQIGILHGSLRGCGSGDIPHILARIEDNEV